MLSHVFVFIGFDGVYTGVIHRGGGHKSTLVAMNIGIRYSVWHARRRLDADDHRFQLVVVGVASAQLNVM